MKEHLYYHYNPNTKTKSEGYTWEQLLYDFYEDLSTADSSYSWRKPQNPFDHYNVSMYFLKFGHSDKDGYWYQDKNAWRYTKYTSRVEYIIDPTFVGPLRPQDVKKHTVPRIIKEAVEEPKKWLLRNRIVDSFGRTISAGYLKTVYKQYKPISTHKKPKKPRKIWNLRYTWRIDPTDKLCGYTFRSGPVPGIHQYMRGWGWRKTGSNRAGRASIERRWFRDNIYSKEIFQEYGITFKMDSLYETYHNHHHTRYHGWKRSKKRKQWM